MKQRTKRRRGYPVAILVGLEDDRAFLWKVFSNVTRAEKTLWLNGTRNDPNAIYNFNESIVNALRPALSEGVRSIILISPARTNYTKEFVAHVIRHHAWLVQGSGKAVLSETTGSASTLPEVAALTKTTLFRRLIEETTSEETENLIDMLEKRINSQNHNTVVLYSLKEIEDLILDQRNPTRPRPEYIILTDKYLLGSCEKNRIYRLMQIARNKNIKTRIVKAESKAGLRLTQLGGTACFARTE